MNIQENDDSEKTEPCWSPLTRLQRRVAGVLVEKSKTTPDIYPMTVNAIKTAANQKSNRHPKMELDEDDVKETLDELRELGAVIEVIGDGSRMPKYKHRLYDWLGVDRAELAVMAELLLRGEQTIGDLRARAARMEKISGVGDLKPILKSLIEKKLLVELTPPGRGQFVTHHLYEPDELERLKAKFETEAGDSPEPAKAATTPSAVTPSAITSSTNSGSDVSELGRAIKELQQRVGQLEQELTEIKSLLS